MPSPDLSGETWHRFPIYVVIGAFANNHAAIHILEELGE
jgi:hypothetical protein